MMNVEEDVDLLKKEIKRLGKPQDDGSFKEADGAKIYMICIRYLEMIDNNSTVGVILVTFGVLFNDDRCANIFEALVGTLRAAKKRKVLTYDGELLLQGVHDNVEITLKPEASSSDVPVKS